MILRKSPLSVAQVLAWADAHRRRTGRLPAARSGPVTGAPGDSWQAVNRALSRGCRDLPGASSLARLLEEHRGKRNRAQAPRLTEDEVLRWAELHRARTGRWPTARSGPVDGAPGETWKALESALHAGGRGLAGGETLARFLHRHGWGRQGAVRVKRERLGAPNPPGRRRPATG
jgi:hypothetical protein